MTPAQITVCEISAILAALSPDDREQVESITIALRGMIKTDRRTILAIALVGAEMAATP